MVNNLNMKTTVSVGIPTYNGGKFILKALQSVLNQTVKVDHIYISDNRSDDDTIEKVKQFIAENKLQNITININETNIGAVRNWNKLFELAKTDYMAMLHVDDLLRPETIEKQKNFLDSHPDFALAGGVEEYISLEGQRIKKAKKQDKLYQAGDILGYINGGMHIHGSTVMFNLKHIHSFGYFDDTFINTDELYWFNILREYPICVLGDVLADLTYHPEQDQFKIYANRFDDAKKYYLEIISKAGYEKDIQRQKIAKKTIRKKVANNCYSIGLRLLKFKKSPEISWKYYRLGYEIYPASVLSKAFFKSVSKSLLAQIKK